ADDLLELPPLVLRQRSCFLDLHLVTDPSCVLRVVCLVLLRAANVLLVHRVQHSLLDGDDDRLLHLVAHDCPDARLSISTVCIFHGVSPDAQALSAISRSRRMVLMRAICLRVSPSRDTFSSCPV